MTNRLSEDVLIATWDSGRQLPTATKGALLCPSLICKTDLNELLEAKDPKSAVQAVDRRDMYLALVEASPEDALEVMPLLSKEQFVALIDYNSWDGQDLSIHKAIKWLELYRHHGLDQLFERYRELDEEYQTGLISPYVQIVDEEAYEVLSHEEQDQYRELPCHTLWYRIKGNDQAVEEFVNNLVEGGLGQDVAFIYSLLAMATYLPPNEQEDLLRQFRTARLEEDGFATPSESREVFMPFDGKSLFDKWQPVAHDNLTSTELVSGWQGGESFLNAVFLHIQASGQYDEAAVSTMRRSFAMLANTLAAACHVGADEPRQMTKLLEQCQGLVSLGLEILANGRVDKGAEILFAEQPKVIFRFALSTIDTIRDRALSVIQDNRWPGYDRIVTNYKARKFGATLWYIDRELVDHAGTENVEILKGLFNRLPMIIEEIPSEGASTRARFRPVSRMMDIQELQRQMETMRPVGRSVLEPVTASADAATH